MAENGGKGCEFGRTNKTAIENLQKESDLARNERIDMGKLLNCIDGKVSLIKGAVVKPTVQKLFDDNDNPGLHDEFLREKIETEQKKQESIDKWKAVAVKIGEFVGAISIVLLGILALKGGF